ncbi:MAG: succinoglycan biosynthesis transport protein ExoP [Myxococcota bacterium]|jgi:succinoglycan biosynthesis transport protein ExoP
MTNEAGLQIDLIGGLKRRGYIASVIAGAITLVVYWIAMALPNEYTASAILLVEPQAVNERLVEAGAAGVDLNERLNLMTAEILSRTRLSRIIEELQLYQDDAKTLTRQEIVDNMRSMVSVRPVIPELTRGMRNTTAPEINTFQVFFTSASAKTAADVAQKLANDFIQEHISDRVKTTQTSLEFISAEEVRLATRIAEIDSALAEIKERNALSLPENLGNNQRTLERDLGELRYAQRQLDVARSDLSFWEHQFRAAQAIGQDEKEDALSPARRVQGLELQLKELLARGFTERHPDLISLKAEIASNQREQERVEALAGAESEDEPAAMNFPEQNAAAEMQRADLHVKALEQEVIRIEVTLDELRANLAGTPRVAEQLDSFQRQHAQLSQSLLSFSNLRLEAAVQADLERRQLGERFRILESAIPPRKISSPNRGLILILGLVFGMTVGAVVGVAAEGTDPSFHVERDLQSSVGIPVLAVIPAISFEEDLERVRRSYTMRAVALTAIAGFGLLGGFGTYMFVNGVPGWLSGLMGPGGDDETEDTEAYRYQVQDPWA